MELNESTFLARGASRVSPFFVTMMMPNATAGAISINFGWRGPNLCIATACAAGSMAIGEGMRLVRDGTADVVAAGGTEAPLTPLTVSAFARMTALSTRNDDPSHASRPFDADRDGFVMAEGAAFLILETFERARRAARASTAKWSATDATPTPITSPRRRPGVRVQPRACSSRSTTPACRQATSGT